VTAQHFRLPNRAELGLNPAEAFRMFLSHHCIIELRISRLRLNINVWLFWLIAWLIQVKWVRYTKWRKKVQHVFLRSKSLERGIRFSLCHCNEGPAVMFFKKISYRYCRLNMLH